MRKSHLNSSSFSNCLVTEQDVTRLSLVIEKMASRRGIDLFPLEEKLAKARLIKAEDAPPFLVTMNSTVMFEILDKSSSGEPSTMTATVVYPEDADIEHKKISVISPLGTAVLGSTIDAIISWTGNDRQERQLRLLKMIYQPEMNGHWHL
jgi:regulator of nucleoside diphosphate kinase